MAEKKFLVDLNLTGNKAKNFRFEDYADNTAPTSNFVGRVIYTTNGSSLDRLELYTGDGWKQVAYLDDAPALDQDLIDIAALTGNGILARQSGVWVMDTNTYLTSADLSGYLTSESDPIYTGSSWYTTTNNASNWDTAYGWGDHGTAGYLTSAATSVSGTLNQISVSATGTDGTGDITLSIPSTLDLNAGTDNVFKFDASAQTFTFFDPAFGMGAQVLQLSASDSNAIFTSGYAFTLVSNNGDITLNPDGQVVVSNGTNLKVGNNIYVKNGIYAGGSDTETNGALRIQNASGGNGFVVDANDTDTGYTYVDIHGDLSFYDAITDGVQTLSMTNDTNTGAFALNSHNGDLQLYSADDVTVSGSNFNIDATGATYFKKNSTEYFRVQQSNVGTTQLVSVDDIAIKSTGGDILLYPADKLGGIGKVYIGYGNANAATGAGVANPGSEVITVDYVTGSTNTLSGGQFLANLIDVGAETFGGYSFIGDGGFDTGMFSTGDGLVAFYSNAQEIAHFNTTTFTVDADLVVTGDITVNGDVTTLNTATMLVEDNIFVLNSNVTGTPNLNAGLEVERGSYTNASILWNETDNNWTVSTVKDSTDAAVTHSIARKYATTLTADPAATSFVVTHSLNTRDVVAQVYTTASPYEQVETTIEYTSVDTITVKFNTATTGDYRVVVTG